MSRLLVGLLVSWGSFACGGPTAEPQTPEEAAPEPAEVTAPRVESTPESNTLPVSGGDAPEANAPAGAPQGKRAPCTTDQSCNENTSVSALWGRCTPLGVCECKDGFERSPTSDLCRPKDAD
jgi:hypothetical protein